VRVSEGGTRSRDGARMCCSAKPPASPDVRLPAVLSWHATAPRLSGCRAVEQSVSRNPNSRIHCASSIFTQTDFAELGLRIQIFRSRGKMARESLGRMSGRINSSSQTDVCRFLEHPLRVRRRTASIVPSKTFTSVDTLRLHKAVIERKIRRGSSTKSS
jgi:hypothetical protein